MRYQKPISRKCYEIIIVGDESFLQSVKTLMGKNIINIIEIITFKPAQLNSLCAWIREWLVLDIIWQWIKYLDYLIRNWSSLAIMQTITALQSNMLKI